VLEPLEVLENKEYHHLEKEDGGKEHESIIIEQSIVGNDGTDEKNVLVDDSTNVSSKSSTSLPNYKHSSIQDINDFFASDNG
jgi:hypothetical protein